MDLVTALEIVHELASQNVLIDDDCPEQSQEQQEACDVVEDFITNHVDELEQFNDEEG